MQFKNGFLGGSNIILPCIGGKLTTAITFRNDVTVKTCVLTGFNIGFTEGDNKFRRATIVLKAKRRADKKNIVDVTANVELRDQDISGDVITGSVYFTLIVE